ncbi:GNAT family N-acetyltransferase [Tissierella sp. MSJ-40]|uniref:GNAT family N-acetyltransferase n=1 Tax=Tissierella simiarum TaxID=2841534 RepID=A0ABS6E8P0_9FIRM|nr:GNAT family protein [Tissierella simiarum]MBU5439211.1 GNAT family N-acetyltransferase [Tissierella simiarum]
MFNNFWIGEKVRLRAVELKDIDDFFKTGFEADTDLDKFCDEIHFPQSKEKMRERLESIIKKEPENDEFWWIIEDLNGNPVGNINTFSCNKRNGTFKYGIGLEKPYWGKGYAKEAIKIVLRYYFRELRYQKVNAFVYSFNEKSLKLHESLGFKQEGRLRRMVYTNGDYFDEIYYGMTVEEFNAIDPKKN